MPGPFDPGSPRWDPTTEIHPGGPHPGMVHQMHEERIRREEEDRIRVVEVARTKTRNHLLLLRR